MPLYEYVCETDGAVIELLRPIADADKPAPDPEGRGRTFKRKLSTFAPAGGESGRPAPAGGGCCPCGKNRGACSRG